MKRLISPAAIGRWSARHPWQAISLWLAFVVVAVGLLVVTGSKQLSNGAVGESARGDALMDRNHLGQQARAFAYLHSNTLRVEAPAFRAAIHDLDKRMTALGTAARVQVSHSHHSALVGGNLTQPVSQVQLQAAVAAVGTAHPQITAVFADVQSGSGGDLKRAE
jgi:RND superfamily putative drug exporter